MNICESMEVRKTMEMNGNGLFDGMLSVLGKALDLRSIKHNTIVSNITNGDTPGYKAFDLVFENEIKKITGAKAEVSIRKTQPGHLPAGRGAFENIEYRTEKAPRNNFRADGNTVDIDKEMSKLSENSLMYNATAQILSWKFQLLKNVITGG
ncbi:flagellar basal body rod protein FlgB [Desulfosarcina sp. BuS5]|uniref:flagellar basal body rod protein FlgB n=2 Tax=Desulfosarcina sp. BuS5 TaxID=933262 RepID=UPI00237810A5|nr:flagellar basal body rod protein FlgB [Desulfosarcina sp. BuS5]